MTAVYGSSVDCDAAKNVRKFKTSCDKVVLDPKADLHIRFDDNVKTIRTFDLKQTDLLYPGTELGDESADTCYIGVFPKANDNIHIFGQAFLKSFYTVFD